MKIEKATKSDIKSLFEIENSVFKNDSMALSLSSFYYHVGKNRVYKVELDGKLAGYILWLKRKHFYRLYSLAILDEFRGVGLAKKLLEHSMQKMSDKNMQLEVKQSNSKAVALYKKFGFKIKKELKAYYDGQDGFLMSLER